MIMVGAEEQGAWNRGQGAERKGQWPWAGACRVSRMRRLVSSSRMVTREHDWKWYLARIMGV